MDFYVYYLICICLTIILLYKKLFRISTGALRFPSIYGNSRFSKQFEITSGKKTINIRTLTAEKRYKCMIFFLAPWSVDRRQQMHKHSVVVLYITHARIETNAGSVTTFVDCICSCMIYTLRTFHFYFQITTNGIRRNSSEKRYHNLRFKWLFKPIYKGFCQHSKGDEL